MSLVLERLRKHSSFIDISLAGSPFESLVRAASSLLLFICCLFSGESIRCYECSSESACDAMVGKTEPQECSEVYVEVSGEIRPKFDRCLRIADAGRTPVVYKRVCGNQRIYEEYMDSCALPKCGVLACYSDKCVIG